MKIEHNRPHIDSQDIDALLRVVGSGFLSAGRQVARFEDALSGYLGRAGHSVVVSSGTSALFLALYALGIRPGDKVIVPTYVCSALLNAVYLANANPVPVDINPHDLNISFEEIKKKISTKTKAIIVSHTYGVPADLDMIKSLGVPIVEDCAQSIGAMYKRQRVGNFGDVSTFSFYATKLLTTGHGGMVYSRDRKYTDKVRDYVDFDCRRNYYPRFNFQMSDIQAALGSSQLAKLDWFLERRENIAQRYVSALSNCGLRVQEMYVTGKRVYYRFIMRMKKPNKLIQYLRKIGIQTIVPIQDWELLHRYLKLPRKDYPIAEEIAHSTISLPVYPALKDEHVEHIVHSVIEGMEYVNSGPR